MKREQHGVKRTQVLQFIKDHARDNGRVPTTREIGAAMDLTACPVDVHLKRLVAEGLLVRREPRRPYEIPPVDGCCGACGQLLGEKGGA